MLFIFRQVFEFYPGTEEPDEGWIGELAYNPIELGRYLEQALGYTRTAAYYNLVGEQAAQL